MVTNPKAPKFLYTTYIPAQRLSQSNGQDNSSNIIVATINK